MTLLALLGEMRFPNFSAGGWWIDLAPLPKAAARGVLGLSAAVLIVFAFFPRANGFIHRCGGLCTMGLLGAAGWSVYRYYHVAHAGQSFHDLPVPFALHVAALLLVVLPGQLTGWWERTNFFKDAFVGMVTLATCVVTFPLANFACVGLLDDRSGVDPALAMPPSSSPGGQTPRKLRARSRTGIRCRRHASSTARDRLKGCCSFPVGRDRRGRGNAADPATGRFGPGRSRGRSLVAARHHRPRTEILALLGETAKFLDAQKLPHVLIVARFFEVPRIRLSLQRAGLDVHAAPIREDVRAPQMRPVLAREGIAFWMCYVQPVLM